MDASFFCFKGRPPASTTCIVTQTFVMSGSMVLCSILDIQDHHSATWATAVGSPRPSRFPTRSHWLEHLSHIWRKVLLRYQKAMDAWMAEMETGTSCLTSCLCYYARCRCWCSSFNQVSGFVFPKHRKTHTRSILRLKYQLYLFLMRTDWHLRTNSRDWLFMGIDPWSCGSWTC